MALLSTLQDRFDSTIDATKWSSFHTGTSSIAQTNGMVVATPPNTTAGSNYAGYDSVGTFDLTANYMVVEIPNMVNVATNAQTYTALILDSNNKLQFIQQNGSLKAQKIVAGVTTTLVTLTYNSTSHQWWRIRENNGVIFFDTSNNGYSWTLAASTANPFVVTALSVELAAGTFQSETSPGFTNFDNFNFPNSAPSSVNAKTYSYHSIKNGAFQGVLTNVISDFGVQQEINSAGSSITIVLGVVADNFGEGTLVDFNNSIEVYAIDDELPNGSLVFKGFIANYQPVFSDDGREQVVLTVLGYGATLNDYIIESAETVDVNSPTQNASLFLNKATATSPITAAIQSFTSGAAVSKLTAVEVVLAAASFTGSVGDLIGLSVYALQTDAEGTTGGSALATATLPVTGTTAANYKFTFASAATITPATVYWVRIQNISPYISLASGIGINIYYDSTAPLSGGILETNTITGSTWGTPAAVVGDLYIKTYSSQSATSVAYLSQDPSAILKSIIDNYNMQGGAITYTASSIDLTNTTVTYTFNTNTVFEGVQKCLQMAPVGWYFYIDQATNVLHFHKIASTPSHYFTFGKNIKNLAVDKRSQEIVNVVHFVGGPTAGVNLYQKYTLQTSVNQYGRHAIRYTDNNVTVASTASIIANSILSNQGQVELRVEMDILDDGGSASSALGFDIETIVLGESVSFRSLGAGTGGSLWDVARWDIAKWDFDITDLSSVVIQVTKIGYSPDVLHLSLSTVPPDITKRVQDIYRNLDQLNVLNNPSTPS